MVASATTPRLTSPSLRRKPAATADCRHAPDVREEAGGLSQTYQAVDGSHFRDPCSSFVPIGDDWEVIGPCWGRLGSLGLQGSPLEGAPINPVIAGAPRISNVLIPYSCIYYHVPDVYPKYYLVLIQTSGPSGPTREGSESGQRSRGSKRASLK